MKGHNRGSRPWFWRTNIPFRDAKSHYSDGLLEELRRENVRLREAQESRRADGSHRLGEAEAGEAVAAGRGCQAGGASFRRRSAGKASGSPGYRSTGRRKDNAECGSSAGTDR